MLPGITYCSLLGSAFLSTQSKSPFPPTPFLPPLCQSRVYEEQWEESYPPPDFFAPNLFPGPSFALFTAPCCACDACRTNINPVAGFNESCAKASLIPVCVPDRAIDVRAARNGGCNRGSSIGVCLLLSSRNSSFNAVQRSPRVFLVQGCGIQNRLE